MIEVATQRECTTGLELPYHQVCVVGLGYIGLPTAAIIAARGYDVHGVDVNQVAVNTINEGRIHIVEPDLDTCVKSVVEFGKLTAATAPTFPTSSCSASRRRSTTTAARSPSRTWITWWPPPAASPPS